MAACDWCTPDGEASPLVEEQVAATAQWRTVSWAGVSFTLAVLLLGAVIHEPGQALAAAAVPAPDSEGGDGIQFAPDDDEGVGQPPPPAAPRSTRKLPGEQRSPLPTALPPKLRGHSKEEVLFGSYRVRAQFAQPKFDNHLEYYDKLYGSPTWYPQLAADWFAWDWYVTFGLSFRLGYYTADGHAAKPGTSGNRPSSADQISKDSNGPTTLTLLPMQACLAAEFTPFQKKWLVIDGWLGLERLYYQEVRASSSASAKGLIHALADTTTSGTGSGSATDSTLTNAGTLDGRVVGLAANIRLNGLDDTSSQSLRGAMGIGSIYLSPFVERVYPKGSGLTFARSVMGIGFTFETIR